MMICELNAVVTGASSGIGKAIAIAIALAGGSVCLVGRDHERLEAVAKAARVTARSVFVFRADLSADCAIEDLARYVKHDFKSFDTLVHCAGILAVGSLEEISVAQLDALYRTNVRAPYALTQALLPSLKTRKGQIVFINSSQGLQAGANTGAYASTKFAMKAIADSLRHEINAEGIRVLSIYPGRTATPRIKALYEVEGQSYRPELLLQPDDVAQVVMNTLQLPRTAEVTNIEIRPLIKSY
jgi:NADP-dependent 3-hydroxy acid dehydrogenase YdfG